MHASDHVMACYKKITSVANTINKLHIMSDFQYVYIHNFYHDKKGIIDGKFCHYITPLLNYIDHPALIQEKKKC